MKVLFISHYSGLGGANLSMLYLIRTLKDVSDVHPNVYIPKKGPVENLLKEFEIPYEIHHFASLRAPQKKCIKDKMSAVVRLLVNVYLSLYLGLRNYNKYDIIYSNSSLVFFGIFLKIVMNKPLVWHLREFGEEDYNLKFCLGRKVSGWLYGKANAVISISDIMTDYYKKNVYDCRNVKTIYNGIDDKSIRCELTKDNNPLKICIVGGISANKNQIQVIEAVKLLRSRENVPKFNLDIIGGGDIQYINELKKIIKQSNLDNLIQFKGHKDINWLYNNLAYYDIGIIPSKKEAFGRVTVEYMLSGVTVVASKAGANVELIDNGTTGILFRLDDVHNLADSISILLRDKDLRNKLSRSAYEMAKSYFTVQVNAKNVYKIFEEVINN